MVLWCYILCGLFGGIVLLFGLFEVHYFLRTCLCVLLARYFKKQSHILDTTTVTAFCLSNDIDTLIYHMNNARYLREIDFARVDFYERTQLYKTIIGKGGSVFQSGTTIRYRRFIRPFSRFIIASKIVFWDDQSIFMEHRFISPSDHFIHCVALCKQRLINCSVEEIMNLLLTENTKNNLKTIENGDGSKIKPELPIEVAKWIECNNISSANLRTGC